MNIDIVPEFAPTFSRTLIIELLSGFIRNSLPT